MKKYLVVYLISIYDDKNNLKKFIQHYNKSSSGHDHDLLICFKNFNEKDEIFEINELQNLKYIKHLDNHDYNDYDWGSYYRIAKNYSDRIILFMNCHSYPIVENWLKKFADNYKENTLIGPGGSFESPVNFAFERQITKNYYKSLLYALSNFVDFQIFPNPHIRSNCFMISAKDFLNLKLSKRYKFKKKGTWINESGRNGMTNQLKKKNYKILIVNSDGEKFEQNSWVNSNTCALGNQNKLIISDKYSRIYENSSENEKKIIKKNVWGKYN